ncbi:hypothetical protein TNCT1_03860 [Streptomyces sp. 1-11]|nr:hypothetical protein TNCT1_03860 [Streptomyces sp. 1-11]
MRRRPVRSCTKNVPHLPRKPPSIEHVKQELGRAGISISDYDIVHVPEIRTPDGVAFGNSPRIIDGSPMKGPRGLPLIEISDIGLRDRRARLCTDLRGNRKRN